MLLNRWIWKVSNFLNAYLLDIQPHTNSKPSSSCVDEKYHLFSVDSLPVVKEWKLLDYQLLQNYKVEHGKDLKHVKHRQPPKLDYHRNCLLRGVPHHYLYENNIARSQMLCKVCR